MFGNSPKFAESESAFEICNMIIVLNKISNTTNETKFGVLSNKI